MYFLEYCPRSSSFTGQALPPLLLLLLLSFFFLSAAEWVRLEVVGRVGINSSGRR